MSRALQIVLLLAFPLLVVAGMVALDRTYGLPTRGRDYVLRIELPQLEDEVDLPDVLGPPDASRPLIVIDAGHGGHDPGAGTGPVKEKTVTLRLAQAIRDALLEAGGVRVALTRDGDSYLTLAERSGIARRLDADLFLSIHADSAENEEATGASVYVLSEKGSSEAAARIAARENEADTINGVDLSGRSEAVSAILLDLSQRDAQDDGRELARLILREIKGKVPLHRDTVQSAAFGVLKSPDVPSVLFETGFISNTGDAAYLFSPAGRQTIAGATARAVRTYFARQAGA